MRNHDIVRLEIDRLTNWDAAVINMISDENHLRCYHQTWGMKIAERYDIHDHKRIFNIMRKVMDYVKGHYSG
jgi:hypothetical protein